MALSFGLGLPPAPKKGVRLFPQASAGWDFVRGTYKNAAGYVRTNLVARSHGYTSWTPVSTTLTNAADIAPDGTNTADKVVVNAGTNTNWSAARAVAPVTSGVTYTTSIYLKPAGYTRVQLTGAVFNGGEFGDTVIDLTTNTVVSGGAGVSFVFTPAANGYTRVSGTWTASATGGPLLYIKFMPSSVSSVNGSYTADGVSGGLMWGLQQEVGGYASSLIVTGASPVSVITPVSTNPADVGNMTFTRASTGYAEDAQGNLVLFGSNVPRITDKGVLIEEGRTNVLLRSQQFTQAWQTTAVAATTDNYGMAPDGTMTAARVQRISSGGANALLRQYVTSTAQPYVLSFYVKSNTPGTTYAGFLRYYDNVTGNSVGFTADQTWKRVVFPITSTGAGSNFQFDIESLTNGADLLVWGAQMEPGSFATSYIPTTSSMATRAADVFSYAHTVAAVGTVGATATPSPTVGSPRIIGSNSGAVTYLYQTSAAANNYGTYNEATTLIKSGATAVGTVSAAVSWDGTNRSVTYNGLTPATSASAISNGSVTAINIGSDNGTSNFWNNYIQRIAIYPFAASDAQLQTISSGQF